MTHTEALLLEMLKATTLALRVVLGHVEAPFAQTARAALEWWQHGEAKSN